MDAPGESAGAYAVHTGRRNAKDGTPEYGVQLYYSDTMPSVGEFALGGGTGQVKSLGGYVMAAGSIHPDSGEAYEVMTDAPVAPLPGVVRSLKAERQPVEDDNQPITENRNIRLTSIAGKLRNAGLSAAILEDTLLQVNADRCVPPLDDEEVQRIAANAAKWELPKPEPVAVFGEHAQEPEPVKDWRELFHTKDDALNAPPIQFLVAGFLQREGVTAIAGPVRERKSLIALNVAHALLTGEKLFDHFEVVKKPERVLYLCPEVSLGPFTDRLKKIGLLDYVGESLFYRTLSADGHLTLNAPELQPALPGAVVILDTAIRFLEGDENSSRDVRAFADGIFALLQGGAESVVMLHHSPKESGDVMTLENAMRGSGDMGAFLACCWGTRLQDPTHPYESASFLSNLKQRDFESKDFEATCTPDCRMHVVGDPETQSVTLQGRKGFKGNKDGKDDAAIAIIKASPTLSNVKLSQMLKEHGIERSPEWVRKHRIGLLPGNQLVAT